MEKERLIEINQNGYLMTRCFNQLDYERIDKTLELLSRHHVSDNKPKIGDLVEGAYYDGAYPFKYGRIDSIDDDKITVCCQPYVPFVSFDKAGSLYLSMSGGPFITYDINDFVFIEEEKAQYAFWGCEGPCANGAIHIETPVARWRIPYVRRPISYVSEVDEVNNDQYSRHDAKVILHQDYLYHFARFGNMSKLKTLLDLMGLNMTLDPDRTKPGYKVWCLSHQIIEGPGFWKKKELPTDAQPFVTLSNGSFCTCYFLRDDKTKEIVIYRPNPNAKEVYDAFPIEKHIAYRNQYGEAGPIVH